VILKELKWDRSTF